MKKPAPYVLNLPGLTANKQYEFEYVLDDAFFAAREQTLVLGGQVVVQLLVDRTDRLLTLSFHLHGLVRLTCDRSLEEFDYPLDATETLHIRFGGETKELADDVLQITPETQVLPLDQHLYDYVVTALPMKKLHPRFVQADAEADAQAGPAADQSDTRLIYSASTAADAADDDDDDAPADPRWAALRNLN